MKVFEQTQIGSLILKNRIVMPPMCMYSATSTGFVTSFHPTHYATRAVGGVGLIIQEATAVRPEGRISGNDLGIWSDDHVQGLSSIVSLVHENGGIMGIQLAHAGRKCLSGDTPKAPSALPFSDKYPMPQEMTLSDIDDVVHAFRDGANRAKKAGYDLVEIHAAHGYLLNEFLSSNANKRQDRYGGDLIHRATLLLEVIAAVRQVWNGPLCVRVSAEEYLEDGNHLEDTLRWLPLIRGLVDVIHVSSGGVAPVSFPVYPGYQLSFAEAIKKLGFTVIGGGLVTEEGMIKKALSMGIDYLYCGRKLLRDPYYVLHLAKNEGKMDLIPKQYERGFKE